MLESAFRSAGNAARRCACCACRTTSRRACSRCWPAPCWRLQIGDPGLLATDVGPVIDETAKQRLEQHAARMMREGRLIQRVPLRAELAARLLLRAPGVRDRCAHPPGGRGVRADPARGALRRRPAGAMIDAINATGYGLTLGVHSRIDQTVDLVLERARAGNIYVNRNMIGAVVGVQPFGGERLSGTGPKAGGRTISPASPPSARSASTPPRSAATPACSAWTPISHLPTAPPDPGRARQSLRSPGSERADRGTAPHARPGAKHDPRPDIGPWR